ncbi:MAG: aldo/keto reductase [Propionibacteriaceae bacterium]|jgi:aryl-alcohol dehydrogenase-like predicted oxidoreductase|nr:aldo/keto reductase [Propionibacteriaceae bacterium]
MQPTRVGTSDLVVSPLGLGTMSWGAGTPTDEAAAMLTQFVDHGGTLIDTAAAYGFGEVEALLGRLMTQTVRRTDLFIATKAGFVLRDGVRMIDNSRTTLLADLDGSLKRLGTDWVDLWQIHAWSDTPLEETLSAADEAVATGKARAVGVSNFVGWQVAQFHTWQKALTGAPIVCAQAEYSLLARRAELELIPCVEDLGVGFFPWSSLGRGVLTGKYLGPTPAGSRRADPAMAWFVEQYLDEESTRIVSAVVTAANGLGLTPAQVALMWVREAPGVTAALIGPRTVEQLTPLLDVADLILPDQITSALDDVSGGPHQGRGDPTDSNDV